MSSYPKESDWKHFRKIVPALRERYLEEKNKELAAILSANSKTPTEQFWDTLDAMKKTAKILVACLDGHSRSQQYTSMSLMCRYGMLKQEDLEAFSPELKSDLERLIKV